MPLTPIPVSATAAANSAARQLVQKIMNAHDSAADVLTNGIPAIAAVPGRSLPSGQVIAGRDATPAITPAAIIAEIPAENMAVINALMTAFASSPAAPPAA